MGAPGLLKVGFPFLGYFARGPKHEAPSGYFTNDSASVGSRDWDYAPKRGKWKRRAGSAIKGDTFGAQVGILPAKWSAKGRRLFEMVSASLAAAAPTVAGLWTSESGVWGQGSFYNTNTSAWQHIGSRMQSDYPLAGANTPNRFRMIPVWSENPLTFSRCTNEKQTRMLFAGSRNVLRVGNWVYAPNAQGTPLRWNASFNDSSTTAYVERIRPSGHYPPLMVPNITAPAATTAGYESWTGADRFIYTIAYRFEDGSISRPFIPLSPTEVPAVAGTPVQNLAGWLITLNAAGGNLYKYITYNNIADGGPGTISKIIMRTPKVTQSGIPSLYAQVNGVSMLQLGIVAEIPNGIYTYNDYAGNDASLFVDPVNIRFADHKWPRRGRYMFTFDGHVAVCGALKENPVALIASSGAVFGVSGPFSGGGDDNITAAQYVVIVREDQQSATYKSKSLFLQEFANNATTGIPLSSSVSLRSVLATVLSSVAADTVNTFGRWVGQLRPGVNWDVTTDNIEYTQVYANFITVSGSPTITVGLRGDAAAGNVAQIKTGMAIQATSGIPAGTLAGAVNVGAGTVGLVDSTGAAVNATQNHAGPTGVPLKIGWDFGDTYPGEQRCNSTASPGLVYFTKAYLDTLPTDFRAVDFTGADPGHPRDAANSWYVQNTRSVPAEAGYAMGGGQVKNAGIVYYSRGKALLTNIRAGKSGLDADWTMQFITGSRGAISPSIVQGNGWVAALTADGIEVTDEQTTRIITGAIYDPGEQTGELAYEIAQCVIAARTDTDGGFFNMMLSGSKLRVSYRSSSSVTYPDRYMTYDFSPSEGLYGVPELLRPDGSPYGWSCPHQVRVGAMCEVQDASGTHLYGMIDANAGSTGNGRVDEFETGTSDNAVAIAPVGYHAMLTDEEELQEFWVKEIRAKWKKNGTGFSIGLSRDKNRTGGNVDLFTMPTSGTDEFKIRRLPATQQMAGSKEVLEFFFTDDGSGTPPQFEGMQVEVEKVANLAARR